MHDIHQKKNTFLHPLLIGNEFSTGYTSGYHSRRDDYETLTEIAEVNNWKLDFEIKNVLKAHTAVIVTDIHQKIEWVSSYFETMTGYDRDYALQKRPNFLQGSNTSRKVTGRIRDSLQAGKIFRGTIINYKSNGEPYTCKVEIRPVYTNQQLHVNFIAFETDHV